MPERAFPAAAVALLLAAMVVVFFPTLFFGQVISPLDVLFNEPPWQTGRHLVEVTNPELRPAATGLVPLLVQARQEGIATAIWNPRIAAGVPGLLSWSNGLLSPFVLFFLPWVEPAYLLNAMVLGKLVVAFFGAFLLLRGLALGRLAAAVGASAFSLSGPLTAQWLWPASSTTAALPLLLWAIDRSFRSPQSRRQAALVTAAWLLLGCGGAQAETLLCGALAAAWLVARLIGMGRAAVRPAATVVLATILAAAILAPALRLEVAGRSGTESEQYQARGLGWTTLRLLVDPYPFGDPRRETFDPPPELAIDALHQCCLAVGVITATLALIGALTRSRRMRFWIVLALVSSAAISFTPLARVLQALPGLGQAPPAAMAPLLALALSAAAAHGVQRLSELGLGRWADTGLFLVCLGVILEQGLFAGHLLAYLPPEEARLSSTPGIEQLQQLTAHSGGRVAPLLDTLWPNTATAFGLDDLRSLQPTTTAYRSFLQSIDPQAWGHFGDATRLNAATADLVHPYLAALSARWIVEPPQMRLMEFALARHVVEIEPRTGRLGPVTGAQAVTQRFTLPHHCTRVGLYSELSGPAAGHVRVSLEHSPNTTPIASTSVTAAELAEANPLWIDVPPRIAVGSPLRITVRADLATGELWMATSQQGNAVTGSLSLGDTAVAGSLALAFDTSGYAIAHEGADLRVWENRRALPVLRCVGSWLAGDMTTLLEADPPLPLDRVAVVSPEVAARLGSSPDVADDGQCSQVQVLRQSPSRFVARVHLTKPALLVTSIPASSGLWRARRGSQPVPTVVANGLFVAVPMPAGEHKVELEAAISLVWWCLAAFGILVVVMLAVLGSPQKVRPQA